LKQNPPPVAPITKRTPEEDKKHAKMLERGKAFRGTSAASAAASAPAPAPAPSAPTKTLKRREIVSSDREVAPPPLPEQTKVIANQLREIGTLNDKVKNLDRKVNPIMARLRELGRKPEKNATDIAKLNQQGQSIAADATELRTQARQAISTLKAARKKEPKSADPAVQRLFGTADDGIKAAETVASQADAVAKVATATPTNLGTLLDQYKSKQYVQKPLTELELAKKQLVRSELEIKEKGWKKSGGKKKRKQTRKNRYR
jgi:hypothetical protein